MLGHKRIPSREGGVEIVVEELSTRMSSLGHDVTVYNRGGKHDLDKNIKIENLNNYKGVKIKKVFTIDKKGLAAVSSSFFATLKALFSKVKVVHFHAEGPCYWTWIIKRLSKKRVIATIHGLDWQRSKWGNFASKFIKKGEQRAVKYADEIIVLSKSVQEYFKKTYNRNTVFIPNGVNKPEVRKPNIIKNKYNLDTNEYILFLARIVPEKGLHYLIDAYNQVKTDKKLVIAGSASNTSEYYTEILNKAKSNKNIILTGFVEGEELDELYSNCYLYCLPSDVEGMPISLLEAMSYGKQTLVSDIDENKQVIGNYGLTFKKSDISDLKDKLEYILNNKNKYNPKEIQDYILNKYNWDKVVEKTLDLYGGEK
ncbi:MAG: glycosyltransferase family 4 protein [Firmicutes bacterium]|nr:glycosyltransferase family 4 protein [Bacillota bacterium]